MEIDILGIDLAEQIFRLHGADRRGRVLHRAKVSRGSLFESVRTLKPRVVVMEACSSAHHWARRFQSLGTEVQLISLQYVAPFVKTNRNDRNDAEVIVEAASRLIMPGAQRLRSSPHGHVCRLSPGAYLGSSRRDHLPLQPMPPVLVNHSDRLFTNWDAGPLCTAAGPESWGFGQSIGRSAKVLALPYDSLTNTGPNSGYVKGEYCCWKTGEKVFSRKADRRAGAPVRRA